MIKRLLVTLALIPVFSFASSLPTKPGITSPTRTTSGYNFKTPPANTTYKVIGTQTTPAEMQTINNQKMLMNAETQDMQWPNGQTIEAALETGVATADLIAAAKNLVKGGKVTPAQIAASIAGQVLAQALIDQGEKWMQSAQDWERGDDVKDVYHNAVCNMNNSQVQPTHNFTGTISDCCQTLVNARPDAYKSVISATVNTQGVNNANTVFTCKFVYGPNNSPTDVSQNWISNVNSSTTDLGTSPATDAQITADLDAWANKQPYGPVDGYSKIMNDVGNLDPTAKIADNSPQQVRVPMPTQTTDPVVKSVDQTQNPDGSTTTKTTQQSNTINVSPGPGNTLNNTSVNVNSTTNTTTTTTNNTTNTTTTETKQDTDPTPTPEPDPAVAPPPSSFPPVPSPTPVPDAVPNSQTSFLSWSPFSSFSFTCNDPSIPILDKQVAIPLCQWIEKIRVFFFWFWNVATAIGIYLLGRGFNINTASAKPEE